MSDRFYVEASLAPGPVELEGAEAHHLATVSRLRKGEEVVLFNGDGHEYRACVAAVERRRVVLEVLERHTPRRELPFVLEVAAPLPKGDRAQFLVEKLTELGVVRFVPLSTRRSVVHPREAKLEKLERYVIEASKQCRRNTLMAVEPLTEWTAYSGRGAEGGLRVLAHPAAEGAQAATPGSPLQALRAVPGQGLVLAVGPEGGFTGEEVEAAGAAGWRLLDLGPRILRVETAALVLAAWAVAANT